ncbi:MAG TPA: hypothetical protein VGQ64_00860 [Candidatus Limnocylindrales bacterium]|nr:hypothetical protein [Candidatus Limnocylindrales bacterium]
MTDDDRESDPESPSGFEPPSEADFEAARIEDAPPEARRRRRLQIAILLTLIAAILVFAAVGGRIPRILPGKAAEPPSPARIAVVDANGALSVVDADGGNVVPYDGGGVVSLRFPAWSPDRTQIAAIRQDPRGGSIEVYGVRSASSQEFSPPAVVYQSADRPPFYLYWSPDSANVSFLTTEPAGIALRIGPHDASSEARVVHEGAPFYWDWVDPGGVLAHVGGSGQDGFLGELRLDGGTSAVPGLGAAGAFRAPTASHDGLFRAYVTRGSTAPGTVVVEARDGSSRKEIPIFGVAAVSFDPAGRTIAFVAPDKLVPQPPDLPFGPLRLIVQGSDEVRTLIGDSVIAFFWAPDGRTIAALRLDSSGGDSVGMVPSRGAGGLVVAAAQPQPSSGGRVGQAEGVSVVLTFIDVASGSTRGERPVRLSTLFVSQLLPYFDQYALSHRFWAADSSLLALPLIDDDGVTRVVAIPPDGSASHPIADAEVGFWSP